MGIEGKVVDVEVGETQMNNVQSNQGDQTHNDVITQVKLTKGSEMNWTGVRTQIQANWTRVET